MNEPRARMSRLNLTICAAAVGSVLLMLYVLSTGPFAWLLVHGYISQEQADVIGDTFYAPVGWSVENFPAARAVVQTWVHWWSGI
ncbi:MAG TPA: hypothetical protein VHB77_10515 [Planctomycetaceae bacterium]|nr:hypothetical protein [Planctomycetaceae bacterium]